MDIKLMEKVMEANLETTELKGKVLSIPLIDETLAIAGQAADAKATGEAIKNVYKKPSGSYVGNGSKEPVTISTGAKGVSLQLVSENYVACVTPYGAMVLKKDGSGTEWLDSTQVSFSDDLYLNTDHEALNALDLTYSYQVL